MLLLIQRRVQKIACHIQIDMSQQRVGSMSFMTAFLGTLWSWEIPDTTDEPDVCISQRLAAFGAVRQDVHFYSEPHSRYSASLILSLSLFFIFSLLPLSLHCEPKHSPPSHDDNGSIKDFFGAWKPWQRPV